MAHQVVLVVEDEPSRRRACEAALQHAGYHVLHACDGEEAVRISRQLLPDLILLDLDLPVKSGIAAFEEIRRLDKPSSGVPIVAMTPDAGRYPPISLLTLGFDGCVQVPCESDQVLAEVTRLIGPASVTFG